MKQYLIAPQFCRLILLARVKDTASAGCGADVVHFDVADDTMCESDYRPDGAEIPASVRYYRAY